MPKIVPLVRKLWFRIRGLPVSISRKSNRFKAEFLVKYRNSPILKRIFDLVSAPTNPGFDPNRVKQYKPVGRCIYCGATGGAAKLSREHILAYCLGGDAILPDASCQDCADITKKFENYCADKIFQSVRVLHGVHSRREAKKHLQIYESFEADPVLVPAELHPGILFLPSFDLPGIVMGREPTAGTGLGYHVWNIVRDSEERTKALRDSGYSGVKIKEEFKIGAFLRLLAKTAHCIAVAEHGIDNFKPLLRDVILTEDPSGPYYVGCAYDRIRPPIPFKHWATKEVRQIGEKSYVVIFFRLFAYLGTPVYCVVVGEDIPRKTWFPLRMLKALYHAICNRSTITRSNPPHLLKSAEQVAYEAFLKKAAHIVTRLVAVEFFLGDQRLGVVVVKEKYDTESGTYLGELVNEVFRVFVRQQPAYLKYSNYLAENMERIESGGFGDEHWNIVFNSTREHVIPLPSGSEAKFNKITWHFTTSFRQALPEAYSPSALTPEIMSRIALLFPELQHPFITGSRPRNG